MVCFGKSTDIKYVKCKYLTYYLIVFKKIVTFCMINVFFFCNWSLYWEDDYLWFLYYCTLSETADHILPYLFYNKPRQDYLVVGCLSKYSFGSVYCTTSFQHLVSNIVLLHVFAWWWFQSKPELKGKNTLMYLLLFVKKKKHLCLDRQLSHVGGSVLWNHYCS